MKWYLHRLHQIHLADVKVKREDPLEIYYPWVIQIANTFTRDAIAIGALNLQDLVQAGYVGLLEAWDNIDEDRDQAQKWSFIKKRIKGNIRREIDNYGTFIKVPRRALEEHRKELSAIDKVLVNTFPKFFDVEVVSYDRIPSWQAVRLEELIDDYLYYNFPNKTHVNILKDSFGIDRDKKVSLKDLALQYDLTEIAIKKIKSRMINKIKEDKDFEEIIINFYQE